MPNDEENVDKFDRYMTVGHAELRAGRVANSVLAFEHATEVAYAPFVAAHAHLMLGKALRLLGKTDKAYIAFKKAVEFAAGNEPLLARIEREQKGGV